MRFEQTHITSRQNPVVMGAARLTQKKYRDEEKRFLICGLKLTIEALRFGVEIERLLVREDAAVPVSAALKEQKCVYAGQAFLLGESAFSKISPEKSPDGVICVAKTLDNFHKFATIKKGEAFAFPGERLLLLEAIRDPGNLGTILRSAAAFGIDKVILSADCAELYHPKTLRAAMGAIFKLPTTRVDDLPAAEVALCAGGRRVLAAALTREAGRLDRLALDAADCFLIGNEGHGLSPAALASATQAVFIPMRENTESLNAAMAASVCLWEQARQLGV